MTEHTADPVTQDGAGTRPEPPRLGPRPLERPAVDAEAAAVFGRPQGVDGAFEAPLNGAQQSHAATASSDPRRSPGRRSPWPSAVPTRTPTPSSARRARPSSPDGADAAVLGRGRGRDPWRDPESPVELGPPAGTVPPTTLPAPAEGARLSLREVLFGRRVHPRALAALGSSRCWSGRPAGSWAG